MAPVVLRLHTEGSNPSGGIVTQHYIWDILDNLCDDIGIETEHNWPNVMYDWRLDRIILQFKIVNLALKRECERCLI